MKNQQLKVLCIQQPAPQSTVYTRNQQFKALYIWSHHLKVLYRQQWSKVLYRPQVSSSRHCKIRNQPKVLYIWGQHPKALWGGGGPEATTLFATCRPVAGRLVYCKAQFFQTLPHSQSFYIGYKVDIQTIYTLILEIYYSVKHNFIIY